MKTNFLFIIFFLGLVAVGHSASVSWDGGGGADNSWGNPLNWDNDMLPTLQDDVDIAGGVTVVIDIPVAYAGVLFVNASTLIINEGSTLNVNTTDPVFSAYQALTVGSNATLTNNGEINISIDYDDIPILIRGSTGSALLENFGNISVFMSDMPNDGIALSLDATFINHGRLGISGTVEVDLPLIAPNAGTTFTNHGLIEISNLQT